MGRDEWTTTAIRESHMDEVGLMLVFGGRIKSGLEKRADGIPQWDEAGRAHAKEGDVNKPGLCSKDM